MFFSEDSNGEIIIRKEKFGYWLRKDCYSVTEYGIEIPYVNRRGKIMYGDGTMDEIGIRIAMYVNKKKVENLKS